MAFAMKVNKSRVNVSDCPSIAGEIPSGHSYQLINENQVVSIEGLRVSNMVRNRHLSKAIRDSGWGEFARQLQYKAEWYGHTVKVRGMFCPAVRPAVYARL